jgi:hypothetical protein
MSARMLRNHCPDRPEYARGYRVLRVRGVEAEVDAFDMGRLCAQVEGYNVQAATRIAANDREALERMGRYLARPPIATDRLSQMEDGRLELRLKRAWRDGTTAFRFTPHEAHREARGAGAAPEGAPRPLPWRPGSCLRSQIGGRTVAGGGTRRDGAYPAVRNATGERASETARAIPVGVADLARVPGRRPCLRSLSRRSVSTSSDRPLPLRVKNNRNNGDPSTTTPSADPTRAVIRQLPRPRRTPPGRQRDDRPHRSQPAHLRRARQRDLERHLSLA